MTTKIATTNIQDSALTTLLGPKITTIVYPGDDTATDTAGGQTINLTGSGFQSGCSVLVGSTASSVVTFISTTQISFTAPAMAAGTYVIYVINPDGGTAISIPGISYSGTPTWSTSAGTLGTAYETGAISATLTATGDAPITYSLVTGTLPTGSTLNSNGTISGTAVATASITTYSFTIKATDAQNQDTNRAFSLTINPDVVTWSSPANLTTYNVYTNAAIANVTMSATSASGGSITYTADTLPSGLSITGANIAGTPTVVASTTTVLTATSTATRTATRTINWVVTVANDTYWKNVTLLLNGETTVTPFINDASTNSFGLTIVGDTKPVLFNPYTPGYYSNYFDGSGDYLTAPSNAAFQFGTGDFTVEAWIYTTVSSGTQGIFDTRTSDGSTTGIFFGTYSTNTLLIYTSATLLTGGSITINTWTHIAVVRSGTTVTGYINGISVVSGTRSNNFTDTNIQIGGSPLVTSSTANYFTGYISNLRVIKGTALYTTAFTPSTTPLTAITNTSLLTCQSNRFIDNSTNNFTITKVGDVSVSPNIPFTQNSSYSTYGSAYFDGTGDYLVTSGTGGFNPRSTFTIEFWTYPSTIATNSVNWINSGTNSLFYIETNEGTFYVGDGTTNNIAVTPPQFNQWTHIMLSFDGTTYRLFYNGVSQASSTTLLLNNAISSFRIGSKSDGSKPFKGYISDIRILVGTALYTTAFTPPTSPLTAITNTSLLTLQYNGGANNSGIIDNSNFNNIVTRNGNTSQGTFSPYSQTGWSTYFNTDYISGISSSACPSGTGSWTIECWFYQTARSSGTGRLIDADVQWTTAVLSTGEIYAETSNGASSKSATGTVVTLNTWHHVALVKNSNTVTLYYDGVAQGSSWTESLSLSAVAMNIAGKSSGSTTRFLGYISNARIVNGTALYTTTFTPSTTPLTPITNTSLLTSQSNRFIDNGPINASLTINGTPSVQAFGPFGSISEATPLSYSISSVNSSNYVDVSSSSNIAFGSGDYTMEWYTYLTTDQSHSPYMWDFRSAGGAGTQYAYFGSATSLITNYGTLTIPSILNIWRHWAITRSGTTWKLFIDGTQITSSTDSSTYTSSGTYRFGLRYTTETASLIGLVSNLRFVKGQALYTGSFTPSTTPLTTTTVGSTGAGAAGSLTGTVVVLTLNSKTIVDNSATPTTITSSGVIPNRNNPFGYTAQSAASYTPSLHGGSVYFDGTGDYLQIANNPIHASLSNNDFTIECWFYHTSLPAATQYILSHRVGAYVPFLLWTATSTLLLFVSSDNNSWNIINNQTLATLTAGQWYHLAYTRYGSTFKVFLNGVQVFTFTSSATFTATSNPLNVGASSTDTNAPFFGYITDVRMIRGISLYNSNFVLPSTPLTTSVTSGTSTYNAVVLLNNTNGGIVDQHSSNVLETVGNTQLSTSVKKYNNASIYFDGTGDYLTIGSNNILAMGTGDFTVECWIYPQTTVQFTALILTGTFQLFVYNGALYWNDGAQTSGGTITLNAWQHIAVSRSGTTLRGFVNGIQVITTTSSVNLTQGTNYVGSNGGTVGQGYIDDLRLTKGYARYTSNFTAPTSALITK